MLRLLRSWQMDQLFLGGIQVVVGTAQKFKISSAMCNWYSQQMLHLLPLCQMDLLLPGEAHSVVVTAFMCKINLHICSDLWSTLVH